MQSLSQSVRTCLPTTGLDDRYQFTVKGWARLGEPLCAHCPHLSVPPSTSTMYQHPRTQGVSMYSVVVKSVGGGRCVERVCQGWGWGVGGGEMPTAFLCLVLVAGSPSFLPPAPPSLSPPPSPCLAPRSAPASLLALAGLLLSHQMGN